jgi:hypothetical protein
MRIGFENDRNWTPQYSFDPEKYFLQADWNLAKGIKEGVLFWYGAYK